MNEYPLKLASLGVDTTVIAARNSPEELAHETVGGVDVHRILTDTSTSVSVEPTVFAYKGLQKVHELHQEKPFDILHILAFPNLGGILRPVPWLASPPVTVADVRGTAVRNKLFDAISRWGIRFQNRLVDRTIVIDPKVAENIFPDTSDISILRLGTDFDTFTPGENLELRKEWGFSPEAIVIGYTGSLHPPRELDRIIDAFQPVAKSYPSARLVIVGDGADRDRLEAYAEQSNASDAINFTGGVPYREMPRYVRAFDIGFAYVPDKPQYRDQPPSKTVEFLAANLPTLASNTPGNREYVTDGENGLVVPDEVDAYSRGLERLIASPDLRAQLSKDARDSVKEHDYTAIVENDLLPVYRTLLDK